MFYITNNRIKVPYVIFGSVYENITSKNIIKDQNMNIIQNYIPVVAVFVICVSLLMISNIPFSSFKDSPFVRKHKRAMLFFIFVSFAAILVHEKIMIFALTTAYVFGSLLYYITHKKALGDIFQWNEPDEE